MQFIIPTDPEMMEDARQVIAAHYNKAIPELISDDDVHYVLDGFNNTAQDADERDECLRMALSLVLDME